MFSSLLFHHLNVQTAKRALSLCKLAKEEVFIFLWMVLVYKMRTSEVFSCEINVYRSIWFHWNTIYVLQLSHSLKTSAWEWQYVAWRSNWKVSIYLYQEVFVFYDLFRKNLPGISEYGFLHTLEQFSKLKGRVRLQYNNIQLIML